jgi:catechol 2,3-dioxygenase-like lactoylglutathione lyase family enzyme
MIRHVSGIAEIVEDVEAAAKFYESLGLKVSREGPDYAIAEAPGILHFGIWNRAHAAESTFGSREATDRVPLGFCLALEVDEIDAAGKVLGKRVLRGVQDEPWGQRTLRFSSPSGAVCEVCETPASRELATNVTPKASEVAST